MTYLAITLAVAAAVLVYVRLRKPKSELPALHVPRTTDVGAVDAIMREGEKNGIWVYEEGRIVHRIRGQDIIRP